MSKRLFLVTIGVCGQLVALTLFLQWPLRDYIGYGQTAANDFGQCLFAVFVAFSLGWTSFKSRHFVLGYYSEKFDFQFSLYLFVFILGVLPWSICILWDALPKAIASIKIDEKFPETYSSYYWIIRSSICIVPVSILCGEIYSKLKQKSDVE